MERVSFAASAAAHLLVLVALIALRPEGYPSAPHADVISVSLHAPAQSRINHWPASKSSTPRTTIPHIEQATHEQIAAESPSVSAAAVAEAEVQPEARGPLSAASAPGAIPDGANEDGAHDMARERIRAMIQERVRYPALARKRGVEGTVVAGFSVGPEGRPGAVRLIRSSGHALLDREVLRAVERASPYPPVSRAVEVPVTFRIE